MNFVTISPIGTSSVLPVESPENTSRLKDLFFSNIFSHLRRWFGSDDHIMGDTGPSVSLEYINLAISLAIYSIRYSAVFWGTNKCLGLIFSIQMLVNSVQILTTYVGISILYKILVMKPHPPIQLNHLAILSLFISSSLVILSSSVVLYLYGHTRFNGFLNKQQEKRVIVIREGSGQSKWSWVAYFGAVVVVVLITPCIGLLINDFVIVNKVCQNKAVLVSAVSCVFHVFIWIIVWGFLLIKSSWTFKLRVTVGKAVVKQPASVKLVTDVDLMTRHSQDPSVLPLLVVGNGETYSVADISPKREIMNIIAKAKMQRKNGDNTNGEQVYFMKPTLVSPKASPDEEDMTFYNRGNKKVTFKEPVARDKIDFDDGDYAALKELPLPLPPPPPSDEDDTISEAEITTVHTVHCLQRDSALLPEELTARSDSMSTGSPSPPDQPESNTSESSSGVHSNESSEHQPNIAPTIVPQHARRASSIANLSQCHTKEEIQWRSGSLQRNVLPPTNGFLLSTSPPPTVTQQPEHGICAVLYETPSESTVVIRRKAPRPKTNEIAPGVAINEEPFGRATNMRMTSFTEHSDLKGMQMTSSTLPHYPTQPIPTPNSFPHCSTMPLPLQHKPNVSSSTNLSIGKSCNIYPRLHTTIPTHHNGVRLFSNTPTPNPYLKRLL
ncbi:protein tincar-like [Photinus pyralis]|nr:protein tincar-like [Photinus pyralis]